MKKAKTSLYQQEQDQDGYDHQDRAQDAVDDAHRQDVYGKEFFQSVHDQRAHQLHEQEQDDVINDRREADGRKEVPDTAQPVVQPADPFRDRADRGDHAAKGNTEHDGNDRPEDPVDKKAQRAAESDIYAQTRQKDGDNDGYSINYHNFLLLKS